MKRIFLTAAMLTVASWFATAVAQTFYELRYLDPEDREEHVGLMLFYDDDDCQMRIVTAEMVERDEVMTSDYVNLKAGKESADDVGVMYFQPEEGNGMPYLIWSWEKDDASDMDERPMIAFDINDADSWFRADYFREISLADMDEEYVGQFYGDGEEEYQTIMEGMATLREQGDTGWDEGDADMGDDTDESDDDTDDTGQGGKTTLHFMMAANTNVSDIGESCRTDMNNSRNEFKGVANALGIDYKEYLIAGDSYGRTQLANSISRLKPGKDDIVVFIYSGHGFRFDNQTDYYPCIDLTRTEYDDVTAGNYTTMTEVYNALKDKGARLCLVLSDCCNSKLGVNRQNLNQNTLFSRSNTSLDRNKLRLLFMNNQGSLLATAASPGQYALCNQKGGFFLLSIFESMRKSISAFNKTTPEWADILNKAIASAQTKSMNGGGRQDGLKYVQVKSL